MSRRDPVQLVCPCCGAITDEGDLQTPARRAAAARDAARVAQDEFRASVETGVPQRDPPCRLLP